VAAEFGCRVLFQTKFRVHIKSVSDSQWRRAGHYWFDRCEKITQSLMKITLFSMFALVACSFSAQAQYFTNGNLAVVRIGGPGESVTTSDSGNSIWIDQYTTSGTLVSSYAVPSTGPNALITDGEPYDGYLTLTPDGTHLVIGGFNTSAPYISNGVPTSINETSSTNVPRAIATIDGYGNYALPIVNSNMFNTYTMTGVASDGTNFWATGTGSTAAAYGVVYAGTASDPATNEVLTGVFSAGRSLNIYNGALYALAYPSNSAYPQAGGFMLANISGALPTNATTATQAFMTGTAAASTPSDLVINPAGTIAYLADYDFGIVKFSNSGSGWVSNYTIYPTNAGYTASSGQRAISVTADFTQTPPVVYATTAETITNRLVMFQDTGATPTVINLASNLNVSGVGGSTNTFRGVRFVPGELPAITSQPAPVVQDAGGNATFTVGASGTPALSYQWYTNSVAVFGATAASLTLTDLALNQSGTLVSAVVSNNYGTATSSNALLTVQAPNSPYNVTINPPTSVTVNAAGTATFNASSVGAGVTYIWLLNSVQLSDGPSISGSSTSTLIISPAYATYDGIYTVIASNSFGAVAGNNSATLTVIDPVIVTQPGGSTNVPSASATLSVTAIGTPTLTYQWLSNGVAVAGATASSLIVANSGTIASALYSVVVSNGLGQFTTSTATTVSFTPVLLLDTFSYPNGNLFGDAGSPWTDINGTLPELVTNGRVQINESNATTDAQSLFSQPESGTFIWASFIINLSTLPSNPGGTYFANIEDTNFGFYGRLFTLTSNQALLTPNIASVAFPGTYRLGIADAQTDSNPNSPSATTGPTAVVPLDLAPGIDYEVVFYLDLIDQVSGMAVNPASLSDVTATGVGGVSSGPATDSFSPTNAMAAFGLRQREIYDTSLAAEEGEGVMELDNLVVSFDWSGPGSGYAAVTGGITPTNPVIGLQPLGTTNSSGNSYTMEVAASGIGAAGTGLTYAWYQNGLPLSDGYSVTGSATPTLTLTPLVATNSGTYYVTVRGAVGGPVQSSNAVVLVNITITPPSFTVQPAANTTNSEGGSVTFTSLATGTGPITYAWYFSNSFGFTQLGGDTNPDLTLSGLSTNQSGTYYVLATGGTGLQAQSSNAVLTVTGPKSVTIGYLRSLLNPTTYAPSDETTLFSVTGVITTATNQTSGDTASYYLQDSTGGINLFVTDGSDFRPALGDLVTATGTLDSYVDNFEIDVTEGGTGYTNYVVGTNYPLPTPILLPWGNDTAPLSPFLSANVEGSVVVITNLYFEAYSPGAVFVSGTDYTVTNNTGETYTLFVSDEDTNYVTGKPIPRFADSVAGPLIQDDTTIGISFTVYSNLVVPVSLPPLTNVGTLAAAVTGAGGTNNVTLTWTAVPSNYTYSVWFSTNLLQRFSNLVSGLTFTNAIGRFTDAGQTSVTKFYEISSP
jgi:hypothetical protein